MLDNFIPLLLFIFMGYLFGSIPTAYLICKICRGIDIRQCGSGNVGATNVVRIMGWKYGILVFFIDLLKGAIPVLIVQKFHYIEAIQVLAGAFAVVGHTWPIYLKFKGGKGVATSCGMFLALAPMPTLLTFFIWLLMATGTGYVSIGSMLAAFCLPLLIFLWGIFVLGKIAKITLAIASLLGLLILIRHRSNLVNLLKGKEDKTFKGWFNHVKGK